MFDGIKIINDVYWFLLYKFEEFMIVYVRIILKLGNMRVCDLVFWVEFEGCMIGVNNVNSKKYFWMKLCIFNNIWNFRVIFILLSVVIKNVNF